MQRLQAKTALVTGAGSGIGAEIARQLAAQGATVIVSDVNESAASAVAAELGDAARALHLDVRNEQDWQSAFEFIGSEFGALDVLVNNAGIAVIGDVEHTELSDFEQIMQVNVSGCFLGCKHGVRHMKAGGGSIINISSVAAMVGLAPYAAYSASKGAVRSLTKSVAAACRDNGYPLRCNSVHPGPIRTPMTDSISAEGGGEIAQAIAAGIGEPEDVAHMVVYLASDESRLLNGTEQIVDKTVCFG